MSVKNWQLADMQAQYFHGAISDSDDTLPALFREVAKWMEENSIKDSQVQDLVVSRSFVNGDDPPLEDAHYHTATVYYVEDTQCKERV